METLTKPKQVGFLEDYKTQFNNLAINVQGLPEYLTNDFFFFGGLKDEIRSLMSAKKCIFGPLDLH